MFSVAMAPLMSQKEVRIIIYKKTSENKWHDERTVSQRKNRLNHDDKWSLKITPMCAVPAASSTGFQLRSLKKHIGNCMFVKVYL